MDIKHQHCVDAMKGVEDSSMDLIIKDSFHFALYNYDKDFVSFEFDEEYYNQCKAANVPFFDKKDTLELNLKQFPNE